MNVWHIFESTFRRKNTSPVFTYLDSNECNSCSMSVGEQLAGVQTAQLIVENRGTRCPGCKIKHVIRLSNLIGSYYNCTRAVSSRIPQGISISHYIRNTTAFYCCSLQSVFNDLSMIYLLKHSYSLYAIGYRSIVGLLLLLKQLFNLNNPFQKIFVFEL